MPGPKGDYGEVRLGDRQQQQQASICDDCQGAGLHKLGCPYFGGRWPSL